MSIRIPFFGLLSSRSPMDGLVEHYEKIAECVSIIDDSLECYVSGGACREFKELTKAIDKVENHADKIKRNIRNHLPRGLFMSVDKTLFLNYTKSQDNILDSAQDALHWLGLRAVHITSEYQKDLIYMLDEVRKTTTMLGPALKSTIGLINGDLLDREGTKQHYREIRRQRDVIRKLRNNILRNIYNSDMDFKDIYQIQHFVECISDMAHNCENCADILRSMIAR